MERQLTPNFIDLGILQDGYISSDLRVRQDALVGDNYVGISKYRSKVLVTLYPVAHTDKDIFITLTNKDSEEFLGLYNKLNTHDRRLLQRLLFDTEQIIAFDSLKLMLKYSKDLVMRHHEELERCNKQRVVTLFMWIRFGFRKYDTNFYGIITTRILYEHVAKITRTLQIFARDYLHNRSLNEMWSKDEKLDLGQMYFAEEYYREAHYHYTKFAPWFAASSAASTSVRRAIAAKMSHEVVEKENKNNNLMGEIEMKKVKVTERSTEILAKELAVVQVVFNGSSTKYSYFVDKANETRVRNMLKSSEDAFAVVTANSYNNAPSIALIVDVIAVADNTHNKATTPILDVLAGEELDEMTKAAQLVVDNAEKKAKIYAQLEERFAQANQLALWQQAAQLDPMMQELLADLNKIQLTGEDSKEGDKA